MKTRFAATLALTFALAIPAQAQVIGEPANGGNCFPFGCSNAPTYESNRYQQVYAASNFASPFTITGINFFLEQAGNLNAGTFDFYLSTTSAAVDGLSSTMNDNLGADVAMFGSFVLAGGGAPSVLSFVGAGFSYDPTMGNLLLDIRATGLTHTGASSYFQARNGNAGGLFSRMHNFGQSFEGWGLVTEFVGGDAVETSEPAALLLLATGILGLAMLGRRREIESV